ncbi:MAG: lytic murein transglycosylase [Alphaproteobacteria bacterium]|nr:lytic murein transglycosylase [Alphaproteobacteria bacterium]
MNGRLRCQILISLFVIILIALPPQAKAVDFDTWLTEFSSEAAAKGISASTIKNALAGIRPIPRVVELDRRQPEFTLTFPDYMKRVVTATRIKKARARYDKHKVLLDRVSKRYGVQPRFIVALWGIETDFGRLTGGFDVIPALATLAHDGRRSAFFRAQLLNALTVIDQGHIAADKMKGSWAGAMGQVQFMPSSFLNFAVDFDDDGRKNLWTSQEDVFGSAANYLAKSGWNGSETWGRKVKLPTPFDENLINYKKITKPLREWDELGVLRDDGTRLPSVDIKASLVRPKEGQGPNFIIYGNYRAILKWNRSHYFALAVGHLADAIIHR